MSTAAPVQAHIEAEDDDYNDADSAIGGDGASSISSINSNILAYRKENGRTYHAYKDGKYMLPNDEQENDRLDLQHHLFCLTFQNKLFVAPIPKEKALNRVLDIGTGTGIWALDFADENPESQVVGIDLSPIQPRFVPPNLIFEIDDIEEEWTFKSKFDFIHARCMTGSIRDWPKLMKSMYDNLTPGGWVQLTDSAIKQIASDDGSLPSDSPLVKWTELITEAFEKSGQALDSSNRYKEQMEAAGFEEVVEQIYKWPINRWPKDKAMKELGMWTLENGLSGFQGLSLASFTRVLGWKANELEVFLAGVRADARNTKIHAYWPIRVVYGKKAEKAKA